MGDMFGISAGVTGLSSGATGAAGYYFQNKDASKAARHARDFARNVMQKQIQWRAKDMQAAGINPILAAGGQPGVINPGQKQIQDRFAGPDIEGAASTGKAIADRGINRRILEKSEEIASAAADKERADAIRADHEAFIAGNEASASVGLLDRVRSQYEAVLRNTDSQTRHYNASSDHLGVQNTLLGLKVPGALYDARVENSAYGRGIKWLKPATGIVGDVSGPVGSFIGGALGARAARSSREGKQSSARESLDSSGRMPRPDVMLSPKWQEVTE